MYDQATASFAVTGAGADVWGTADAFHFAWRPWSGDGTIEARVTSVDYVANWVKAGVMIRASTDPASAHAFMVVSAGRGLAFQRRSVTGGTSASTSGGVGNAPYWVRLRRAGDLITASVSPDGSWWTVVGSQTIPMGQTVLVGLAVSSHISGATATARFDNVSVRSAVSVAEPPPATAPGVPVPEQFTASAKILNTALATTIDIGRWSTDAERDGLLALFRTNQDAALAGLRNLPVVGTIATLGSLKYDVHFARATTGAAGARAIFLLTGRYISAWEVANRLPTLDYPFTAVHLQVDKDGKGVGTASIATKVRVTADGTLELENFSNYSVPLSDVRKVK